MTPAEAGWRLEERDRIAWLTLDIPGQSANVLTEDTLRALEKLLVELVKRSRQGLVIRSGKAHGFSVGADVRQFQHITDPARVAELARAGQRVFNRLEDLPFPSLAIVHGPCLGGGLELALACSYRIARDDPDTRLGLPEVRLGIHPGFAGSVRLPRIIGHLPALGLMIRGRTVGAPEALHLGLVDEIVPERHLEHAALAYLSRPPPRQHPAWWHRLPGLRPLRPLAAGLIRRRLQRTIDATHYPAPYRLLKLWRDRASEEQEAVSIGELLVSSASRNLVRIFLMGEELKRRGQAHPHAVEHVHVLGAGTMGAEIAAWAVHKGFRVTLQDLDPAILGHALKRVHGFFRKQYKEPHLVQAAEDRLMLDHDGHGLARADLVIEAIVEQAEAKQKLLRAVERRVRPQALLATNTSCIPLETLAQALEEPTRLVGLHFFNPVAKMPLVEVVRGTQTSEEALRRASAFAAAIERLPLEVRSSPGFLVNRILMPYFIEALKLTEEGVSPAYIDRAAREFGMPMGPIELADSVGLDICLLVAKMLAEPLNLSVPKPLQRLVEAKQLGKKTGRGFYRYDRKGGLRRPAARKPPDNIPVTDRLILSLLNEAIACLRQGVVQDADAVDAGMVYGTGFAPYLGGPIRYAQSLGTSTISQRLHQLSQAYGERFTPDPGWSLPEILHRPSGD